MDIPLDTSMWQTYRNEEYGFELLYPGEFRERNGEISFTTDGYWFYVSAEPLDSFSDSNDTPWYNKTAIEEEQHAARERDFVPSFYDREGLFFIPLRRSNVQGFTVYKYFAQDGVAINSFFTFFTPTARVRLEMFDLRPEWQKAKTRNEMKPAVNEAIQRLLAGREENQEIVKKYEIRNKMIETIRILH